MPLLIGIDLGTTHLKALAIDEEGHPRASASIPTPATDEGDGRVVYDPEAVWQSVCQVLDAVLRGTDQRVAGIACASMGEAGFLLDEGGTPLWPAIAWFDPRTRPLEQWWQDHVGRARIRSITGLSMDFTYSLNKILWYRDADPDRFARARHWLGMAEWVAFKLSGHMATNYSLASRTMAFDLLREEWADELLEAASLPRSLLPPVLPAGTPLGPVTAGAAGETGLPAGTVVCVGAHDHICAALAAGAITPGVILNSCGTAETMLTTLDRASASEAMPDERVVVGHHLFPNLYYVMTSFRTSGLSADWFVHHLLTGGSPSHEAFAGRAAESAVGARGLLFYPYLRDASDQRHGAGSSGLLVGLRDFHTNADVARALIEGLAFEARRMFDRLQAVMQQPAQVVRAVGGSTANPVWMQVKADVLGIVVDVLEMKEATAYGAALLAGLGTGTFSDVRRMPEDSTRVRGRYVPDPTRHQAYDGLYRRYLSLLPSVIEVGARLQGSSQRR
ncbi:MAG: carbohydrate kinase [Limnochordaceae bacterium]|uniref:FGGY family carbohydrate kinase n=1 Tax=Carboxydichorda subterranea TaxID=3109565 RepID=A0ABZ1C1K6_9FIRM|nr:FGGY family carbohydrate kinase [Limnochorda sp. L945t]MBE3597611.1 carbohydrate kinase [Limnochordaceae bacterium]WRP18676.1 FGGY family carbohydrate kinase [Limnochorda sp. L945t]